MAVEIVFICFLYRCCAAAWEQKMRDTVGQDGTLKHKGAAASAAVNICLIE
jgi:hypothetical protein